MLARCTRCRTSCSVLLCTQSSINHSVITPRTNKSIMHWYSTTVRITYIAHSTKLASVLTYSIQLHNTYTYNTCDILNNRRLWTLHIFYLTSHTHHYFFFFFFLIIRPPPKSTLFPYTPLFR